MGDKGIAYVFLLACGRINHPKYGPCQCAINKRAHKLETGEIVWLRHTEHLALHPELWRASNERHELKKRLEKENPSSQSFNNRPTISWNDAGKIIKTWQ